MYTHTYLEHECGLFIEYSDVDLSHNKLILKSIVLKALTIRAILSFTLHSR